MQLRANQPPAVYRRLSWGLIFQTPEARVFLRKASLIYTFWRWRIAQSPFVVYYETLKERAMEIIEVSQWIADFSY